MATYVPLNGLILPIVELGIRHVILGGERRELDGEPMGVTRSGYPSWK